MNDRDTFAAAALTGILAAPTDKDRSWEYWARSAYEAADAMLRERERVTKPLPQEKRAEVSDDDEQPVRLKDGWWYPKAKNPCPPPPPPPFPAQTSRPPETRQTNHDAAPAARAPADSCVPRGAVDRDSVGTDKAEPLTRDCGTGDISEAQIDALEYVVEEGRIASLEDYGILRSLLVKVRPEWEAVKSEEGER